MEKFDPKKLRDKGFQQQFFDKLSEIKSVQQKNQYIHYALNRPRVDELMEIYSQNLKEYDTAYVANVQKLHALKAQIQQDTQALHSLRKQELMAKFEGIEALLAVEDYEQNRLAGKELQSLAQKSQQFREEFAQWQEGLAAYRMKLKESMTLMWSEDYAELKRLYQDLKDQILGDQPPEHKAIGKPGLFQQFIQRKEQDIQSLRKASGNKGKWKRRIDELATTYVSYKRFEALSKAIGARHWKRRAAYASAAILAAAAIGLGIYFGPRAYFQQQQETLWKQTETANTFESYQHYLDTYPSGTYAHEAHERMLALPFGKVKGLMTEGGTKFDYEGELSQARPEGQGLGVFENGDTYEGEWKQGLPYGQGLLNEVNGNQYQGAWVNGIREGKGKQIYPDGRIYEGMWQNNNWHGKGSLQTRDGREYEGSWDFGRFPVRGVCRYPNGARYEGGWVEGVPQGIGRMEWRDGSVYTGDWDKNLRHGNGTMEWNDRSRYVGQWQNDYINGRGIYTDRFRAEYRGLWKEDSIRVQFFDEQTSELLKSGRFERGVFVE